MSVMCDDEGLPHLIRDLLVHELHCNQSTAKHGLHIQGLGCRFNSCIKCSSPMVPSSSLHWIRPSMVGKLESGFSSRIQTQAWSDTMVWHDLQGFQVLSPQLPYSVSKPIPVTQQYPFRMKDLLSPWQNASNKVAWWCQSAALDSAQLCHMVLVMRVRVVTYATTYNFTPPHGTQLTPHNLKNLCNFQTITAHGHLSMYVHLVFMKFLWRLQRFVPFFVCLKPGTKCCNRHGTPSTWPLEEHEFYMSFSLAGSHSYPGKNIPKKRFSQWHTRKIPALNNTAQWHWDIQGTAWQRVFSEILTRSLRDLCEIGILQGKAAGQGSRDLFYSSPLCSTPL